MPPGKFISNAKSFHSVYIIECSDFKYLVKINVCVGVLINMALKLKIPELQRRDQTVVVSSTPNLLVFTSRCWIKTLFSRQ